MVEKKEEREGQKRDCGLPEKGEKYKGRNVLSGNGAFAWRNRHRVVVNRRTAA